MAIARRTESEDESTEKSEILARKSREKKIEEEKLREKLRRDGIEVLPKLKAAFLIPT